MLNEFHGQYKDLEIDLPANILGLFFKDLFLGLRFPYVTNDIMAVRDAREESYSIHYLPNEVRGIPDTEEGFIPTQVLSIDSLVRAVDLASVNSKIVRAIRTWDKDKGLYLILAKPLEL